MQARLQDAQTELRQEHERLRVSQEELRASRERYAELFDLAPVGYIACDHLGRIQEINSTGAAMLGYTQVALRNQLFRAHVASGFGELYDEYVRTCSKTNQIVETELSLRRRNGTVFPAQLITRAVTNSAGQMVELRMAIRDFSQLKATQDALRRAKEDLERRVEERTVELSRANQELESQMAARSRLEFELLKVSEREKRQFGQDLHDETCQELAGLSLLARVVARELDGVAPAVREKVSKLSEQLRSLVEQTRRIASGLHPVSLSGGLVPVLQELAARADLRTRCKLVVDETISLSEDESLAAYRIAQEAVTNALRHANPTKIEISLKRLRHRVVLAVRDNGIGFDREKLHPGSMGIDIMGCRARSVGADLVIQPRRGGGTEVVCSLKNQNGGEPVLPLPDQAR